MAKIVLLRHLQSQWNKENKFSGWTDVALSDEGRASAGEIAEKLRNELGGEGINLVFTSPLVRNKETAELILKNLGLENLVVGIDKALDERNYGDWTGLNKDEIKAKFGEEQFKSCRRGWLGAPPNGESLQDVYNRVVPFFQNSIEPELKSGRNVLVVASHNSLRALAKYLKNISDEEIVNFEIPSGGILAYDWPKGGS